MYTNYRCIPFPPNDCRVRYYHSEFSTQHCLQCIFLSSLKKKKGEMSFLRVNDLLLVYVILNHDADSSLYIIKMIFSLKINEKMPLEKCVCLLWNILTAWSPAQKLKMTSSFVSAHRSHYAQIWLKGVDIKSATSVLSCLSTPFWCTLW